MTTLAGGGTIDVALDGQLRQRVAALLTQCASFGLAGAIAGGVAIGLGSRLAMRLVALSSGRIGTGVRPDSGAVPGEFTLEGTLFLVVAGTMGGAIVAVGLALLLHRWLPHTGRSRFLVVAALAAVVPGMVLVDPGNVDFALFGPTWFAVVLFVACAVGYGALVALLSERWHRSGRGIARRLQLAAGAAALALAVLATVAGLGWRAGVPVALGVVVLRLAPRRREIERWRDDVDRVGRFVIGVGAVLAVGVIALRAGQILS